jgi:hypothetical protein
MSWVSENKFLTGFGAVMLAGIGTLGWFTYAAMDKADTATAAYDSATAQLKKLYETKPGLNEQNLKELNSQKTVLGEKINAFRTELKARVLKTEAISKIAFQDKLKKTVADLSVAAAAARVGWPKDFYLDFNRYQSQPPDDKATAALDWELRAIEAVMNVLIKTGNVDLEEFHRDLLPEESGGKGGKQRGSAEAGISRSTVKLKLACKDDALRTVLTSLANHKQQLFIIRTVAVQNKMQEPPQRVAAAGAVPPVPTDPSAPQPTIPPAPTPPAPSPTAPTVPPAPGANEGPLAYVFGAEKITATIDLEILNFEEPKAASEKPEKGGKKKDK